MDAFVASDMLMSECYSPEEMLEVADDLEIQSCDACCVCFETKSCHVEDLHSSTEQSYVEFVQSGRGSSETAIRGSAVGRVSVAV